ncbi:Phage-related baseplate assembly protein [Planctomycetes bacterium Pan216]|uniref:Phage-related baseplate assembly protein n=1 Tax=Kolteria novifilia TaxID=2527975 RepID=A0A518BCE1_9BACT|nr:Phage-related baseplate assembly protein [Planctomycetes bacterium Pan216]
MATVALQTDQRRIQLRTPLANGSLAVHRFRGREAISDLFQFNVELLAPNDVSIPFEKLLGQSATLTIDLPGQTTRHLNGIVAQLTRGRSTDVVTSYQAVLVPKLWLLTKDRRSRVFQQKTVVDIVQRLLKQAGIDVESRLLDTYPTQSDRVQYRESTFSFLQRILQESGIYYGWAHDENSHRLVLYDQMVQVPNITEDAWEYSPHSGGNRATGTIRSWRVNREVTAGKVSLQDLSFQLRDQLVGAAQPLLEHFLLGDESQKVVSGTNRDIKVDEHGVNFAHWFDEIGSMGEEQRQQLQEVFVEGKRLTSLLVQRNASQSIAIDGTSDIGLLTPGRVLKTRRTPQGEGSFLLKQVVHDAYQPVLVEEDDQPDFYRNEFQAQPTSVPFRPQVTIARPNAGPEAATVVGPRQGYPHVDKYGRVRVQFSWSDDADDNESCWLRVGHAWAGSKRGHVHLPRVGDEVVVNFYQHDPERPYVEHSMHNAKNSHPQNLPDESHQTVYRSAGLVNESESTSITSDDLASHLKLSSSNDMSQSGGHNAYDNTGGSAQSNISQHHGRYLGGSIFEEVNPDVSQSRKNTADRNASTSTDVFQSVQQRVSQSTDAQSTSGLLGSSSATSSTDSSSTGSTSTDSSSSDASTSSTSSVSGVVGDLLASSSTSESSYSSDMEMVLGMHEYGTIGVSEDFTYGVQNITTFNLVGLLFINAASAVAVGVADDVVADEVDDIADDAVDDDDINDEFDNDNTRRQTINYDQALHLSNAYNLDAYSRDLGTAIRGVGLNLPGNMIAEEDEDQASDVASDVDLGDVDAADVEAWSSAINSVASLFLGLPVQGRCKSTFATSSHFVYGPSFDIHHGPKVNFNAGSGLVYSSSLALSTASAVLAILFLVGSVLQRVANYWVDHKSGGDYSSDDAAILLLIETGKLMLQTVWYSLELVALLPNLWVVSVFSVPLGSGGYRRMPRAASGCCFAWSSRFARPASSPSWLGFGRPAKTPPWPLAGRMFHWSSGKERSRQEAKKEHPALEGRMMEFARTSSNASRERRDATSGYPQRLGASREFRLRIGGLGRFVERGTAGSGSPTASQPADLFGLRESWRHVRPLAGTPFSARAVVGPGGLVRLRGAAGRMPCLRGEGGTHSLGVGQGANDVELPMVPGPLGQTLELA